MFRDQNQRILTPSLTSTKERVQTQHKRDEYFEQFLPKNLLFPIKANTSIVIFQKYFLS